MTLVFGSVRKRPMVMMCSALLAARSPPRPDAAGIGLTTVSRQKTTYAAVQMSRAIRTDPAHPRPIDWSK